MCPTKLASRSVLLASIGLNLMLLSVLLTRQRLHSTLALDVHTPWQPPKQVLVGGSPPSRPPPRPVAAAASASTAADLVEQAYSIDEQRLKYIWAHPPHKSWKETHDSRWAFLTERQLSSGIVSRGDPLRLRCLAEKLRAGRPIHLSVLGGSVSFGTTFTTSKSKALYHWKVRACLSHCHRPRHGTATATASATASATAASQPHYTQR